MESSFQLMIAYDMFYPENGGMAPHQFFKNNYFSEANQLRVLTVHEGHMGHYHH